MWTWSTPRGALRVALDLTALSGALWLAFMLRFEGDLHGARLTHVLVAWPWVVGLQYCLLVLGQVPKFNWSMISVRETLTIQRATFGAAIVLLGVRYGLGGLLENFAPLKFLIVPSSVIVIDAILALVGIIGLRTMRRLQVEESLRDRSRSMPSTRTILVGAGRGGNLIARELGMRPHLGIRPIGFVDDAPYMQGKMVDGLPVLGTIASLPELAREHEAEMALITIASADGSAMRRITGICEQAGVRTKTIPRVHEILEGRITVSQMRDVAIEDLLGREAVVIHDSSAPESITGKVAFVTGAGGSIGSELCRQILELAPRTLVLVEQTENNLYHIHRELEAIAGDVHVVPALADVTDVERMHELFEKYRPHVVFHAAAHKHVPMLEHNPGEAIKNNYFGTKKVADLAHEFQCERFVLISTDKAVNPTSVMGATKRLAELYIQSLNQRSPVRFASVRFGNVLGSAGSVIPLFKEQIARGGPVTVTHPEMERFFMTIPEASRLVLEASGMCQGGEVMVLDMGEPIKIRALAEQMIRLSGYEPGVDIDIVYSGIRPGEKLYEELAHKNETLVPTGVEKISVWRQRQPPASIEEMIVLEGLSLTACPPVEIKARLARVLPEYQGHQRAAAVEASPTATHEPAQAPEPAAPLAQGPHLLADDDDDDEQLHAASLGATLAELPMARAKGA